MKGKTSIVLTGVTEGLSLTKQIQEVGLEALVVDPGMTWSPDWYEVLGEFSDYTICMEPPGLNISARGRDFIERFVERWGVQPGPASAGIPYDYAKLMITAIELSGPSVFKPDGSLDSDVLVDTISKMTFTDGAVMEAYEFEADTHDARVGAGYFIYPVYQTIGGVKYCLYPPAWAEADFKVPPWIP